MQVSFSPSEIAVLAQAKSTRGATTEMIRGLAALATAGPGDLAFLGNVKYRADVANSRASVVLLPADYVGDPPPNQLFVIVDNPSVALARVCSRIEQSLWPRPAPGVHATAHVAPGAQVSASATIGPLCVVEDGAVVGERAYLQSQIFIGHGVRVGDECWLMPGVVVAAECALGRRVRLQPGVIIGSDGFGYELVHGHHEKIPQVGIVEVGDDVEIGANSTVDRARFSRTVIGEGTKIDNLVQVAHNVIIGRHCILCAQVGISGSVTIGDYSVLGGQAGVAGHLTVGKGAKIGGQAGVTQDLAAGVFVAGNPAIPVLLERKIAVLSQRLPELFKRVETLEAQLH